MESIRFNPLLEVTAEEVISLRNSLDLDEEKIQNSIEVIIEWWKKQDHLVEVLPYVTRDIIQRIIIISQGSLETSKMKIDKILTTRGCMPEVALNKSFQEFDDFLNNVFLFILPKPNPIDNTRLAVFNILVDHYPNFNTLTIMRFIILLAEFRTFFDYNYSDRYIIDLKNMKANYLLKIDPIVVKKTEILISGTYGIKIKGLHIVNAPTFVDKFVHIMKQVLKEKLANRIYVHKSYEELYKFCDKAALPEDYGGHSPSCNKLMEQWREYFKTDEAMQILETSNKFYSNESRRSSFKFNEEYLGIPGSFKQLNVD